jgi:hypothetical protein
MTFSVDKNICLNAGRVGIPLDDVGERRVLDRMQRL